MWGTFKQCLDAQGLLAVSFILAIKGKRGGVPEISGSGWKHHTDSGA